MGDFFETTDFPAIDDAATLIDDAESLAMLSAPCIADLDEGSVKYKAAKAIMRGAILRWADAGAGAVAQQNAGPFAMTTTTQARRNSYWPSEITDLQKVCRTPDSGKAYSINTAPVNRDLHSLFCSVHFGSDSCSCGADLTAGNGPLYDEDDV